MALKMQETLWGLCYGTEWCYAVFWKLKELMQGVLTLEEGFYEPIKSLSMNEAPFFRSQDSYPDDSIGKIVEKMSCLTYFVGDGIIGQVAATNKHQWIFSSRERENLTELHSQFAAGIETVAVISVHQGVVQLGSTTMISEDLELVSRVREMLGALQSTEGVCTNVATPQGKGMRVMDSHSANVTAAAITRRMPTTSDDVWSSLVARGRHLKDDQALHDLYTPLQSSPHTLLASQKSPSKLASITTHQLQISPLSTPQQDCIISQGQPQPFLLHNLGPNPYAQCSSLRGDDPTIGNDGIEKTDIINHPSVHASQPNMFRQFTDQAFLHERCCVGASLCDHLALPTEAISASGIVSANLSAMPCGGITSHASAQHTCTESPLLMHHDWGAQNPTLNSERVTTEGFPNSQNSLLDVHICNLLDNYDHGDSMSSKKNLREGEELSSLLCDEVPRSCETVHSKTEMYSEGSSDDILHRIFSSELDEFDHFLDSLEKGEEKQKDDLSKEVCKVSERPVQNASFWDPPTKLKEEEASISCQTVESDVYESCWKWTKLESFNRYSTNSSVLESHNSNRAFCRSIPNDPPKAGRKRARLGQNARPRPKDRQHIQDRVRELRSIIPSSAKCSIDALLAKTIKYMSFLKTVTEEADKWKDDSKLQGYESNGDSKTRDSGASWAVDVSGQGAEGCPLRVEDLSQPHHLLIEMRCEETGIFLEIADTLRGLGLTILKGLMESRDENTWARFVVKAKEDVPRIHVAWILMQFLESSMSTSSNITDLPGGREDT